MQDSTGGENGGMTELDFTLADVLYFILFYFILFRSIRSVACTRCRAGLVAPVSFLSWSAWLFWEGGKEKSVEYTKSNLTIGLRKQCS